MKTAIVSWSVFALLVVALVALANSHVIGTVETPAPVYTNSTVTELSEGLPVVANPQVVGSGAILQGEQAQTVKVLEVR